MSISFSFDKTDLIKVGNGALIGLAGLVVAVLPQVVGLVHISVIFRGADYSAYITAAVAWCAAVVVNALRKWIQGNAL